MAGRKIIKSRKRDNRIFKGTLKTPRRPIAHQGGYYR